MSRTLERIVEAVQHARNKRQREGALGALLEYETRRRDLQTLYWAVRQPYGDAETQEEALCLCFAKMSDVHDRGTPRMIEKLFSSLPPNPVIQEHALMTLAEINSRQSLQALHRLIVRHEPALNGTDCGEGLLFSVIKHPRNAAVLFPHLLKVVGKKCIRRGVYLTAASALSAGTVRPAALRALSTRILRDCAEAMRANARFPVESLYYEQRYPIAVLTLMRLFPRESGVCRAIEKAMMHRDALIAYAAFTSARAIGREPPASCIARFAADPATRVDLWETLRSVGQQDRFPREWRSQQAFAESDLARYLLREEWRVPVSIAPLQSVTRKVCGKMGRYYIFKYKFPWFSREWLIGISGPQPLDQSDVVSGAWGIISTGRSRRDDSVDELFDLLEYECRRSRRSARISA